MNNTEGGEKSSTSVNALPVIESFHVPLPSTLQELSLSLANSSLGDDSSSSDQKSNRMIASEKCVVGQITFMENSVFVWVGWGYLGENNSGNVKTKSMARFGPLVVSYPKQFENGQLASSQLLHSENDEETSADIDVIGLQMASRLSKKVGWPIFVACALGNASELGMLLGGADGAAQKAAALVEKEIGKRIVMRKNILDNLS